VDVDHGGVAGVVDLRGRGVDTGDLAVLLGRGEGRDGGRVGRLLGVGDDDLDVRLRPAGHLVVMRSQARTPSTLWGRVETSLVVEPS